VSAASAIVQSILFYLGTHQPHWLWTVNVPLFVSRRTLQEVKTLRRALAPWALDSGGFTELQLYGRWTLSAADYVALVRRFHDAIGNLQWAAPQDWMCEPQVIAGLVEARKLPDCPECKDAKRTRSRDDKRTPKMRTLRLEADERPVFHCAVCQHEMIGKAPQIHVGRWLEWAANAGSVMAPSLAKAQSLGMDAVVVFHGTGLSVEEHQRRTIDNLLELRRLAPDIQWTPVLQGWTIGDYWRHEEQYAEHGIDLRAEPIVGVGSVCRRQGTNTAETIFRSLAASGLRLHGFGVKIEGLAKFADVLASADSLAWSKAARISDPLPGHDKPGPGRPRGHINCANCLEYALMWRANVLAAIERRMFTPPESHPVQPQSAQLSLF
jgi:hypothetical protein